MQLTNVLVKFARKQQKDSMELTTPKSEKRKKRGSKNTCKITSLDQFRGQAAMRFIGMNQKELKSNLKGMR